MKVAITHEDGMIFQHFGKSQEFKIYDIENGKVISSEVIPTGDAGHCALASFLQGHGVGAVICGGLGMGARNALSSCGIAVYGGNSGSCDEAANAFASGYLAQNDEANCSCHDHGHEEGHTCGHHHGACHH